VADGSTVVADASNRVRADLAAERGGAAEVYPGNADASTFGQFADDAGSVANNVGINPSHDNAQPNDRVQSPLTKRWTVHFAGRVLDPLVANGRVFVSAVEAQPNVRALDLQTGAVLWGPVATGNKVWTACDAANVYTLDRDGNLSAFDVSDGHTSWSTKLTRQYDYESPPVTAAGMVFVDGMGLGGTTYAIDAATGAIRWTAETFDGSGGSVAVAGNTVYEAEACDQVSAFDLMTGSRRWFHSGNCTGGGGTTPTVAVGRVWVRDWAEGNIILDLNGSSLGTFAVDSPPSVHGGLVFYVSSEALIAVDIESNATKWSFAGDQNLCTSAMIAGRGGQVFVGSSFGNVYELDEATGEQRSVDIAGLAVSGSSDVSGMAIAENRLLVPVDTDLVAY
jgi:outer membrane protein assembly factor BamB